MTRPLNGYADIFIIIDRPNSFLLQVMQTFKRARHIDHHRVISISLPYLAQNY